MAKKKNGNGEGTIYQRADGKWVGQITIGRDPENGKLKRKSLYGKRKKDVLEKMNKIKHDLNLGTYDKDEKTTLGEWMLKWLDLYKKKNLKEGTYNSYYININNHIIPAIGDIKLKEFTKIDLQEFYNSLSEQGNKKTGQGLTGKTIRRIHVIIHAALKKAVGDDLITKNVSEYVELPKQVDKDMTYLTLEESRMLLEAAKDSRYYVAILLELSTGLRRGELLGLRWQDLDLINKKLYVKQSIVVNYAKKKNTDEDIALVSTPKTKKSKRDIPLIEDVIEEIKKHKIRQNEEKQKIGKYYNDNDLVFCKIDGSPYNPTIFTYNFKKIVKKAGIERNVRFHDLRHTVATRLIENNVNSKTVQEILGHSTVNVTLNVYTHISDAVKENAVEKLNMNTK